MHRLILLCFAILLPVFASHAEDRVRLSLTDLRHVLDFYAHLTKHKVWVELGLSLDREVSVNFEGGQDEALKVIRTVLLQKNGIEIRETDKATFVSLTEDQKKRERGNPPSQPK